MGYTEVARWEDGVRTAKELPPVLTKAIADVVIRVNQAGFAHGDLHVRNVVLRPPAAGRSGGDDLRARLVLIDLDTVRMVKPCPGDWNEPEPGPYGETRRGFVALCVRGSTCTPRAVQHTALATHRVLAQIVG